MVAASLIAVGALLAASFYQPFEGLLAWTQRYQRWQVDEIVVVSVLLAVVFGFYYSWRKREQLRREVAQRERVDEALRTSAARYRAVVASLPVSLFAVDPEGVFTLTEGKGLEALGLGPDRVVGRSIFETCQDLPEIVENVRRALAGQALNALLEVDGSTFETWYSPVRENGELSGVLGVAVDVTERRRAEERLREAEERYRTLVEQIPAIIYVDSLEGVGYAGYTSPQAEVMLGYSPDEWTADHELWVKLLHPDDRERVVAEHIRANANGEPLEIEYRMIARDGRVVWLRDDSVILRDGAGRPQLRQGVIFDVTGRKEAEEALRRSESTLSEAQRIAHVGSWEWDPRTGRLSWSDEVFRIYGLAPQQFVPTFEKLLEVVHPEDRELLSEALNGALHRGEPYDFEHRIVRPDGEVRIVHRQAEVVRDERGEPLRMVGTVHDITERKALEERLEHQALHDPLTGLPNRALFMDRLRHALTRVKRRGSEVAVLFMDLDNFKVINDSLGHRTGDRVLVAASKRIQALLRPEDTVARLGGDEFVVLLEDVEDADGAIRVAERISEELRAPFFFGGRQLFVTASVGIVTGGVNQKHAADLLRDADLAMYRAKHAGKARHAVFEEAMNARALQRLEMEHDLRRALEREEFVVHYQPIVRLGTGKIPGFEALLRWEHPERGLLVPEEFVPLAEETGLIVPIGKLVLEEACWQAKEWQERHPFDPSVAVCVNLSAKQFREPDLTETVARILEETGLEPGSLFLEVTESAAMSDAPTTVAALEELQDLGVRVLIDDFGTGYSSLSYLERFPLDYLKIDRSFVGKLDEDLGSAVLVSGMIDLAHALRSEVIAEGVETEEQLERLRGVGCDLAQGFHFSEPLPGEAAGALLETASSGRQ